MGHAVAQLGCADQRAYRQTRAEILRRFAAGEHPSDRVACAVALVALDESAMRERSALVAVAGWPCMLRPSSSVRVRL